VTFASYSEREIQQILQARVGLSVVAPNVLDFIAKRVASSTGDARKALEMAANSVRHCLEQTNETDSTIGHLVKMQHVVRANKDEAPKKKNQAGKRSNHDDSDDAAPAAAARVPEEPFDSSRLRNNFPVNDGNVAHLWDERFQDSRGISTYDTHTFLFEHGFVGCMICLLFYWP
jgi:hypothetical protein